VAHAGPGGEDRPSGDRACVEFLQWALPRLGLRWAGFRKVRRQVCRRLRRRLAALGLPDLEAYRTYLDRHLEEWAVLDALTPITISRFYRDRDMWAHLERDVVPALASVGDRVRCWSAGCASGEEAYTLTVMWNEALASRFPGVRMEILATDVEPVMLERARAAAYSASSLEHLPQPWRERGFVRDGDVYLLRHEHRHLVTFARHDVRTAAARGPFDLVLCRNVAFTYLASEHQRSVLDHLAAAVRPGGALVIGLHESLPHPAPQFEALPGRAVFRRTRRDPAPTARSAPVACPAPPDRAPAA
jgi:chemotaxis protein methyltransferase CheR